MATKIKQSIYLTPDDKAKIEARAKELSMTLSAYMLECAMWERREKLIPKLREGETNGKTKGNNN